MTREDHGLSERDVLAAGLRDEARPQGMRLKVASPASCARRFPMCLTAWAALPSYDWKWPLSKARSKL
jgi:hypothetical protein